eukprot:2833529-Prymnesium_polylepis.1
MLLEAPSVHSSTLCHSPASPSLKKPTGRSQTCTRAPGGPIRGSSSQHWWSFSSSNKPASPTSHASSLGCCASASGSKRRHSSSAASEWSGASVRARCHVASSTDAHIAAHVCVPWLNANKSRKGARRSTTVSDVASLSTWARPSCSNAKHIVRSAAAEVRADINSRWMSS